MTHFSVVEAKIKEHTTHDVSDVTQVINSTRFRNQLFFVAHHVLDTFKNGEFKTLITSKPDSEPLTEIVAYLLRLKSFFEPGCTHAPFCYKSEHFNMRLYKD